MKKTLIFVGVGALAVALFAGFAFAGPGMHRGKPRDPKKVASFISWRVNDALDDIDATPAQRTKIIAVKDRLMPDVIKMLEQRKPADDEVKQLWLADSIDKAKMNKLIDQRGEEMQQLARKLGDALVEVHAVLTPAQRAQLAEQFDKHHKHHEPPRHP